MTVAVRPALGAVRYSHTIGQLTQSGEGFNNPVGVAAAPDGRVYVLSRSNIAHAEMGILRVTICTLDEQYLDQFTTFGGGDGQLIWPTAIAIDRGTGHVYVADEQRNDVQEFDRDGQFVHKWGGPGSAPGQLNHPSGLAVDSTGDVLVVDSLNNRVQRWSREGRWKSRFGGPGTGSGQFNMPWGIAVDAADNLYVADWRNSRVQKLTRDGRHLATFGGPGKGEKSLDRPAGLAVDGGGYVWVSDYGRDQVKVFGPDGQVHATLSGDATMTRWAAPFVAADPEMSELRTRFADDVAQQERVFEGPIGIAVTDDNHVLIADCCKHRVQVYQRG
ncbi:MAG: NHL repeat-containing protein [Chloroflexota bacterium]